MSGMYTAASALDGYRRREEAIAQNLANLQTTGYKRSVVNLETFGQTLDGAVGGATIVKRGSLDMTAGQLLPTGSPLDVAIQGDAFLAVQTDAGIRYTRNGALRRSGEGMLVDLSGHEVQGEGGSIDLGDSAPADVSIDGRGQVVTRAGGGGTLRLQTFPPGTLVPEGNGLYRALRPGEPADMAEVEVHQGFLEGSNANAVSELIGLVEVHRSFEAATKTIETTLRTLERTTSELG